LKQSIPAQMLYSCEFSIDAHNPAIPASHDLAVAVFVGLYAWFRFPAGVGRRVQNPDPARAFSGTQNKTWRMKDSIFVGRMTADHNMGIGYTSP
jgi:hypothetical protein